jgi:hypothetical protein
MLRFDVTRSGAAAELVAIWDAVTYEYPGHLLDRVSRAERREELVAVNGAMEGRGKSPQSGLGSSNNSEVLLGGKSREEERQNADRSRFARKN